MRYKHPIPFRGHCIINTVKNGNNKAKNKTLAWTLDIHLWLQSAPANITSFITAGSCRILSDHGLTCEHSRVWKVMINKNKLHSILCSVVVHSRQSLEIMSFLFHFSVFTQTQTRLYSEWKMKPKTIIPAEKAHTHWSGSNAKLQSNKTIPYINHCSDWSQSAIYCIFYLVLLWVTGIINLKNYIVQLSHIFSKLFIIAGSSCYFKLGPMFLQVPPFGAKGKKGYINHWSPDCVHSASASTEDLWLP